MGLIIVLAFSFSQKNIDGVFEVKNYCRNSIFLTAKAINQNDLPTYSLDVIESSYLKPNAPPFLVTNQTLASVSSETEKATQAQRKEIEKYVVQEGDTLESIALNFGISVETIVWANNLSSKSAKLKPGQELIILPVSGVLHLVSQGETLSEIAKLYKVSKSEILDINNLDDENKILAGDFLVIPGGKPIVKEEKNIPIAQNAFIFPVSRPFTITQGLHWYNAIDFSTGNCGDPVFAVAGGVVQKVGFNKIGGNFVEILHPNGVITYYGHLSAFAVQEGESVHQGTIIGYIGATGFTIPKGPAGCHLHFDVRFGQNPFAKYSAGTRIQ